MIAFVPNDRSVVRLPAGTRLQTGYEAETLCQKRIKALRWLKQTRAIYRRPRPQLRVVS